MYSYPDARCLERIAFPPIRKYFPKTFGMLDDTRLGFHHSTLSTTTVSG